MTAAQLRALSTVGVIVGACAIPAAQRSEIGVAGARPKFFGAVIGGPFQGTNGPGRRDILLAPTRNYGCHRWSTFRFVAYFLAAQR